MPSITYIEEDGPNKDNGYDSQRSVKQGPEPPTRYNSNMTPPIEPANSHDNPGFESARRLVTIAEIMALVSLVIGGVLLSSASVIVAIHALRKINSKLSEHSENTAWLPLRRSAIIAIAIASFALMANVVALIIIFPMVMESLQSGEYASLFNGSTLPQNPISGSSTWG